MGNVAIVASQTATRLKIPLYGLRKRLPIKILEVKSQVWIVVLLLGVRRSERNPATYRAVASSHARAAGGRAHENLLTPSLTLSEEPFDEWCRAFVPWERLARLYIH